MNWESGIRRFEIAHIVIIALSCAQPRALLVDFFPGPAKRQAAGAMSALKHAYQHAYSDGEPISTARSSRTSGTRSPSKSFSRVSAWRKTRRSPRSARRCTSRHGRHPDRRRQRTGDGSAGNQGKCAQRRRVIRRCDADLRSVLFGVWGKEPIGNKPGPVAGLERRSAITSLLASCSCCSPAHREHQPIG